MRRLSKDNTVNINGVEIPLHLIKSIDVGDRECTVTISLDDESDSLSEVESSNGFGLEEVGSYYTVDGRCCSISGLPLYGKIVIKLRQGEYILPESAEIPDHLSEKVHKARWDRGDFDIKGDPVEWYIREMTMEGFTCNFSGEEIPCGTHVIYSELPYISGYV